MPEYRVPVIIEVSSEIEVEADSPEEAIEAAKALYYARMKKANIKWSSIVDGPCIEVDFAGGDDPGEVVELDLEEEEEAEDS